MKTERDLIDAFAEVVMECENQMQWLDETALKLLNCFAMIQKHVITSTELLSYYWKIWLPFQIKTRHIDNAPYENQVEFKHDYQERQMIVARSAVIFSLSIVEFMFRTIVQETTRGPLHDWYTTIFIPRKKKTQHLYLSRILQESRKRKFIDKDEFLSWRGILKLRNILVHNNGISDRSSVLKIGDLRITIQEGAMTKMALLDYPAITKTLIILTRSWLEMFLQLHTMPSSEKLRAIDLGPV